MFKDFFQDTTQRVVIGNTFSEPLPVFSKIPQGGVIGPLLFIININDIVSEVDSKSNIKLFADDAKYLANLFSF